MCPPMCDCKLMFFTECVHDYVYIYLTVFVGKGEGECRGVYFGVIVENESMGAGLCASVLAVNVIVFWLGLSGVPSSGLVEILAALTSPSLSQFDSWWDLRWNVRVWIASNIHNNLISLLHLSPFFPSLLLFYSTLLPHLYLSAVILPSVFCVLSVHAPFIQFCRVQEQYQPSTSQAIVFLPDGSLQSWCH